MPDDDPIDVTIPPSGPGCVECTATDGWWFHLRRCAHCGHIGCCDSSPSQHAMHHAADAHHRYIRSFEPGEDWFWSWADEAFYDLDGPPVRITTPHIPLPAADILEDIVLPTPDRIADTVRRSLGS